MKILILGLNYAPEQVGIAVYTTGMARHLAAQGHEVAVVAGQPYYPQWRTPAGYSGWQFTHGIDAGVAVTRVPHYVPAKPTGLRRILHHLSFALMLVWPALWQALVWRPDVVIAIAPSLLAAPVTRLCARIAGAASWLHVQDFEAEAARALGFLGRTSGAIALKIEHWLLSGFDRVSSISAPMGDRLIDKGIDPAQVYLLRNWADDGVGQACDTEKLRAALGLQTSHLALYAGSIAHKQGLDIVVAAARALAHRQDITFLICGNGPQQAALQAAAADIANIRFLGEQPVARLAELLQLASVQLLPQRGCAADLMLPSKLANMLASGRPIVATAPPGSALAREVEHCGIVVPPGDGAAFADAVARLIDDEALRRTYGAAGRVRARRRFDRQAILGAFDRELQALAQAQPALPQAAE